MIYKLFKTATVIFCLFATTGFYVETVGNLNTHLLRGQERHKLLSALNGCESKNLIDQDCAMRRLTKIAQEPNDSEGARQIVYMYNQSLNEGNQSIQKCQRKEFQLLNKISAYCVLQMHRTALETQNQKEGIFRYQQCIKGNLITLAYEGNIGAQMRLTQIFQYTGDSRAQKIWEDLFKSKVKDPKYTELVKLLVECYS